jgi:hypothetical protein
MKALTIWQPWASLIMVGAKPYEFRRWDFRAREARLVGERIVIHAGTRPAKLDEVEDVIADGRGGVAQDVGAPLLKRLAAALRQERADMAPYRAAMAAYRARQRRPRMVGDGEPVEPIKPNGQTLPLACGLGTAKLLKPRKCTALFGGRPDAGEIDLDMWAWPLAELAPFAAPIPCRGAQGFWDWPFREERVA